MKWVKLHTTLHDHPAFELVSDTAQLVYYKVLEIAGQLDSEDGALFIRGVGPMNIVQIATRVRQTPRKTTDALKELVKIGFITRRPDSAFVIEKWAEKTGPDVSTARVRAHRKRKRNADETVSQRLRNGAEGEGEVDSAPIGAAAPTDPNACKTGCAEFASEAISDNVTVEAVVDRFLEVCAHCKNPTAKSKYRALWVGWLRAMRDEAHPWAAIVAAAAQAHVDGEHAPIRQSGPIWTLLRGAATTRGKVIPFDRRDLSGGDSPAARMAATVIRA